MRCICSLSTFVWLYFSDAQGDDDLFAFCGEIKAKLSRKIDHHRVEVAILKQENLSLIKQAQTFKEENARLSDENDELRELVKELETDKSTLKSKMRHQEKNVRIALKKLCAGILGKGKGGQIKINIEAEAEQEPTNRHIKREKAEENGSVRGTQMARAPVKNRGRSAPVGKRRRGRSSQKNRRSQRTNGTRSSDTNANSDMNNSGPDDDNDEDQQLAYLPVKMEPIDENDGFNSNTSDQQSGKNVRYKCSTCPVKFESIVELKQHQVGCLVQFDCRVMVPRCDKDANEMETDQNEMIFSSSSSSPAPLSPSSPTMAGDNKSTPKHEHKCNHSGCEKRYKHKSQLEHHQRTHLMIRTSPRTRPVDDRGYFVTDNLLLNFSCRAAGCNMAFNSRNAYDAHTLTHSEDKPFRCRYLGCDEKFVSQSSLVGHVKNHSDTGPIIDCTDKLVENELCISEY